jgi:hypothetical protein
MDALYKQRDKIHSHSILAKCFQSKGILNETQTSQIHIEGKQAISSFYRIKSIGQRRLFPPPQVPHSFDKPVIPQWPDEYTKATTLEEYLKKSNRKIQADAVLLEKLLL